MINNISFGMKLPTKQVIRLVSEKGLSPQHFEERVNLIHKLINNRTDITNRGGRACAETFKTVSEAILDKYPSLKPFAEKLSKFAVKSGDWDNKAINRILASAEKKLGNELDISTDIVEKAVGVERNPLCAFVDSIL